MLHLIKENAIFSFINNKLIQNNDINDFENFDNTNDLIFIGDEGKEIDLSNNDEWLNISSTNNENSDLHININ